MDKIEETKIISLLKLEFSDMLNRLEARIEALEEAALKNEI